MVRAVGVALVVGFLLVAPASAAAIPPVCPGGNFLTAPGTPLTLAMPTPLCSNLTAPPTFVIPPGGLPTRGTLNPGPPVVYTPNAGFHGFDQFRYAVSDPVNGLSNEATVRILVDRAPVCSPASLTAVMNTPTVLPDVDCSDPDGDTITVLVDDTPNGTVDIVNGEAVYTPKPNFTGTDTMLFAAEDQFGLVGDEVSMTITVTAPTPQPTVVPTPPPAPKDTAAPVVTLSAKKATFTKGIPLTLRLSENASAKLTISLDAKSAKKYKLSRTIGTLNAALTAGDKAVTLKLSAKARKAFKKLTQMKVTVTAVVTDAAGNKTTKTLKVTIRKK